MVNVLNTHDINFSKTRGKQGIGICFLDENGNPVNGTHTMSDNSVMRFKDGFIDGDGLPAIEYEYGGTEYWSKGFPNGQPAVISDFGTHEEDWIEGILVQVRDEYEIKEVD